MPCLVILKPSLAKNDFSATNSLINPVTLDENKNSKVSTFKIFLDSVASASIVSKDVLYECHKILKDKKNKRSTLAGTFNTTFVTEIILKLLELNQLSENLREMPFDGQIIKLRFNPR